MSKQAGKVKSWDAGDAKLFMLTYSNAWISCFRNDNSVNDLETLRRLAGIRTAQRMSCLRQRSSLLRNDPYQESKRQWQSLVSGNESLQAWICRALHWTNLIISLENRQCVWICTWTLASHAEHLKILCAAWCVAHRARVLIKIWTLHFELAVFLRDRRLCKQWLVQLLTAMKILGTCGIMSTNASISMKTPISVLWSQSSKAPKNFDNTKSDLCSCHSYRDWIRVVYISNMVWFFPWWVVYFSKTYQCALSHQKKTWNIKTQTQTQQPSFIVHGLLWVWVFCDNCISDMKQECCGLGAQWYHLKFECRFEMRSTTLWAWNAMLRSSMESRSDATLITMQSKLDINIERKPSEAQWDGHWDNHEKHALSRSTISTEHSNLGSTATEAHNEMNIWCSYQKHKGPGSMMIWRSNIIMRSTA